MRRSLRSGSLVLLALASLLGGPTAAEAAPAEGDRLEPPTRKERIEEIWLDARGESGWIRTVPMYLDDAPAEYRFGPAFCGRSHRLGEPTLRALQAALAGAQPVRVDASPAGDEGRRCVTGVAFFAP